MHSIRTKITVITVIAMLTTLLCVFAVSFYTISAQNDRESMEMMNLIAKNTKRSIGRYTDSIEQSVDMASNIAYKKLDDIQLINIAEAGKGAKVRKKIAEQDRIVAEYCSDVQEMFDSVSERTNGVVSYFFVINPEISRNEHGFFYSRTGGTKFLRKTPIDAGELDPDDTEHNSWWFDTKDLKIPVWVGPLKDLYLGDLWICSYVIPIHKGNDLIGVLGMDIQLDTIISQVRSIRVYKTGFASLIARDYSIIYHPEIDFGTPITETSMASVKSVMEKSGSSEDKLIRFDEDGVEKQLSFSNFSSGMKIAVIAPTEEINAGWNSVAMNSIFAAVVIIIIFALIVMFLMNVMTRPILQLADASRTLADGGYDVELDYKSNDEIGVLTSSFTRMRDQMKAYIEDLNRRIYTDDLTGLPNMRYFFILADEAKRNILESGGRPVMAYINLIGMKHFNRLNGYEEGNRLICEAGELLKKRFGEKNICRLNQDRFGAVADQEIMEKQLKAFFADCDKANDGKSLPVRVGLYPYSLGDVNVDAACDRAKYTCDRHRNTYSSAFYYFDHSMQDEEDQGRYVISHIDQALAEGWIQVYYQSIMFASTGKKCDEEALSRWIDPEKGFLPPDRFIPYLERSELIYKLDLYVLDQVLKKINLYKEAGREPVPVSVNLSRTDFDALDMVEEIRRRVDAAGVSRDMITIEITESTVGSNFDFMKKQVERFHALGFPVWMDDFGSGYSSLDTLQDIQFDLIKLDMRFMHRFDESEKSKIIVRELLQMASGLRVDTICEGVELDEQVRFLRTNGCTKIQGFYYSKPAPFDPAELS